MSQGLRSKLIHSLRLGLIAGFLIPTLGLLVSLITGGSIPHIKTGMVVVLVWMGVLEVWRVWDEETGN